MNRRSFFRSLVGLFVAKALAPIAAQASLLSPAENLAGAFRVAYPIEPGEALFFLPDKAYSYRYVYRNSLTGCCSDASPVAPPPHTFMMPEHDDVIDVYRLRGNGEFEWFSTHEK